MTQTWRGSFTGMIKWNDVSQVSVMLHSVTRPASDMTYFFFFFMQYTFGFMSFVSLLKNRWRIKCVNCDSANCWLFRGVAVRWAEWQHDVHVTLPKDGRCRETHPGTVHVGLLQPTDLPPSADRASHSHSPESTELHITCNSSNRTNLTH